MPPCSPLHRHLLPTLLGLLHALRDLLLPEAAAAGSSALFDSGLLPGEGSASLACRLASRSSAAAALQAWRLPQLYAAHPELLRSALAVASGLLLLAAVLALRCAAEACLRCSAVLLFRSTGLGRSWAEEASLGPPPPDENPFWEGTRARQAEAAAAAAAAKAGRKAD